MTIGRPVSSPRAQQPYRLRTLLRTHGIAQEDLRRALRYSTGPNAGKPLAASTLSQLLLRREWAGSMDQAQTRRDAETFLQSRGVPAADIAAAWDADGDSDSHEPDTGTAHADDYSPEPEMLSQHARDHFRITRSPFIDDVQSPADVFLTRDSRYVKESMFQAARNGGFLAVVGESGSGKTTLRRDLLDRVKRDSEPLIVIQPKAIDKTRLSTAHICDALVADLSGERPKLSLEAKARQVERLLTNSAKVGNRHVLLIEEAHDLSIATMKYLKRFWELEDGFRKLLGVVLIGQPELGDKLNERMNYDMREVIRRCEVAVLRPLDEHLEAYLAMKFKRVGLDAADLIDAKAYDAIRARLVRKHERSGDYQSQVYPLIVHNLLTRCLNEAAELGLPKVTADLVASVGRQ